MTDLPEIGAETGTRKPVPVADASDMRFGTEFFWYQLLVTNRACSAGLYGTSFLVCQRRFLVRVAWELRTLYCWEVARSLWNSNRVSLLHPLQTVVR